MGVEGPSKYWCCANPQQETIETMVHVFLRSNTTNITWSYFCSFAGLNIEGLSLIEVIMLRWGADNNKSIRPYYKSLPCIIVWEL